MKMIVRPALLISALLCTLSSFAEELSLRFSADDLGRIPAGFESVLYGEGEPGLWRLIEAEVPGPLPALTANAPVPTRPVLAQLSRDLTDERFPILVYTNEIFRNFTFTTRVKCVSGVVEQMAGVVFRYVDTDNFYYLRASAKGNTFRFFKVVRGQRSNPIGPEIQIPAGEWHELKVECEGNRIRCFLNGKQAIPDLTDYDLGEGKIGFWTKSDSVSYFVDAHVQYTPRESFAKTLLRFAHDRYPRVLGMRIYAVPPGQSQVAVVASTSDDEVGNTGTDVEKNVLAKDSTYFGRLDRGVVVTMPLHDRNGDTIAALRVEMKSFPGQTQNNALARALPIVKDIEKRLMEEKNLF